MHPELSRLLDGLNRTPDDDALWHVTADWLEEHGEAGRAEILRLGRRLRGQGETPERRVIEDRIIALLRAGVRPCVPEVVNGVGMRFAVIPAGAYLTGRHKGWESWRPRPALQTVEVTRPFWMGVLPVTQAQYEAVTGANPSHFRDGGAGSWRVKGMDTGGLPVESVSWDDARRFCERMSDLEEEKAVDRVYRLPTGAEWEFACRAGLFARWYHLGDDLADTEANFYGSGLHRTSEVGSYPANAWGLYDMHGNVQEWCQDEYAGPETAWEGRRAMRGGSWALGRGGGRASDTEWARPDSRNNDRGLRVVLTTPGTPTPPR